MVDLNHSYVGAGRRAAFTLIEVLAAIGVIAVLVGILIPSLSAARRQSRAVLCQSQLRSLMEGLHAYSAGAEDAIIPSYNMRGVSTGVNNPLDGWGPILDRDAIVLGSTDFSQNPFACPDAVHIAGMRNQDTGADPSNPKGYMDWPAVLTISQNFSTTIPAWNFNRIIRVAYWINGDNPIGRPQTFTPGLHYTGSVGYGPDPQGKVMTLNYNSRIKEPSRLIALADGLYSGKQDITRLGSSNTRIGYRHSGRLGVANAAFADGHVGGIEGDLFPRRASETVSAQQAWQDNMGDKPTVYADPSSHLAHP